MERFIPGAYDSQEERDLCMLREFAKSFANKFHDIKGMPKGWVYDATNTSTNGEPYIIELKERIGDCLSFPDCFIEMGKYLNLKKEYNNRPEHPKPLYINFFNNGDVIYIWDLSKMLKGTFYMNKYVKGHTELQDRLGLKWENGSRFEKQPDGKYIMTQKAIYN